MGIPPCLIVALAALGIIDQTMFAIMFVSTITVAGADTIASEIGVRDDRVYMITTGKRVEPGINGGVSPLGTATSTVASLLISFELFGFSDAYYFLIAIATSYMLSGYFSLYHTQRITYSKFENRFVDRPTSSWFT